MTATEDLLAAVASLGDTMLAVEKQRKLRDDYRNQAQTFQQQAQTADTALQAMLPAAKAQFQDLAVKINAVFPPGT